MIDTLRTYRVRHHKVTGPQPMTFPLTELRGVLKNGEEDQCVAFIGLRSFPVTSPSYATILEDVGLAEILRVQRGSLGPQEDEIAAEEMGTD